MSEKHLPKYWYNVAELEQLTKNKDYSTLGKVRFKTLRFPTQNDQVHFYKKRSKKNVGANT